MNPWLRWDLSPEQLCLLTTQTSALRIQLIWDQSHSVGLGWSAGSAFGGRVEMELKLSSGIYSQGSVARGSISAPGKMDVVCFGVPKLARSSSGCPQDGTCHARQLHTVPGAVQGAAAVWGTDGLCCGIPVIPTAHSQGPTVPG